MPRGSNIGERRGGRQRGTPNRRTVLVDRIMAHASERPAPPASEFLAVLVKDQELPADIRMAIARECLSAGTARSVGARDTRSCGDQRNAKSPPPRRRPSRPARSATLDALFGIAQDMTVPPEQRRKAASQAAQHLLPKQPGIKRWWVNAPADRYGFAITPPIAAEYRDGKNELRRLNRTGGNSPAKA